MRYVLSRQKKTFTCLLILLLWCTFNWTVTRSTVGTAPILLDFPLEAAVTGRPKRLARSSFFSSPTTAAAGAAAAPPKRAALMAARSASVVALPGLSALSVASVTASVVVLVSTAVVAASVFFSSILAVTGATMVVFAAFGSGVLEKRNNRLYTNWRVAKFNNNLYLKHPIYCQLKKICTRFTINLSVHLFLYMYTILGHNKTFKSNLNKSFNSLHKILDDSNKLGNCRIRRCYNQV